MNDNRDNLCRISATVLVVLGSGWAFANAFSLQAASRDLDIASHHLVDHDFGVARQAIDRALKSGRKSDFCYAIAGAVYAGYDNKQSIEFLNRVSDSDPILHLFATREIALRHYRMGHAHEAETYFDRALQLSPNDNVTCNEYSNLLSMQGRTWEALPLVHRLFRQGDRKKQQVLKSAAIDGTFAVNAEFNDRCIVSRPNDPIVYLVDARRDLLKNRVQAARDNLEKILKARPDLIEAQVRLGRVLLLTDTDNFLEWHKQHAVAAECHPELWCLRGMFAERLNLPRAAIRFYLEALRQYPDHQESNARLSQLLSQHGHEDLARQLGQRARDISQMVYLSSELAGKPKMKMIKESAELMFRNGRFWEAAGWCETYMGFFDDQDEWALEFTRRIQPMVCQAATTSLASPTLIPAGLIDRFPLVKIADMDTGQAVATSEASNRPSDRSNIRFRDIADEVGLQFEYVNGGTERGGLEHMLQSTGGGIGVLDFDLDTWPDLYFAQSNRWFDKASSIPSDQLFRNIRGESAQLCSDATIDAETDFSQGIACGDYNGDGFPDIFVANVGANRLFLNNGDGTFSDQTPEAITKQNAWTLSAAFADLNHDGFPEIYVVNYLVLKDVLDRMCKSSDRPMGCAPTMFPAEQDRLYENRGDGSLADVTGTSGIVTEDGKGLGVVIADLDHSGDLELFVGNDTTANFLFRKAGADGSLSLTFEETGVQSGVAFDEGGNAQSCMGIGLDDANNDGLLDIFVTNFYADANTLYLQTAPNIFRDATRDARLRDSGFNMLGFGCQFLDADLDGWRDIVVTNGHVDHSFASGVPDAMPPQFFHNQGNATFAELPQQQMGHYFGQQSLGRTLVVLDWDQDGLEDFCVSHLDRRAALLRNSTKPAGRSLQVRLIGVTSERIPVGSRVEVATGTQTLARQLTGGGGYEGTNESVLTFGVGNADAVDIRIVWPSGRPSEHKNVTAGRITIVEGRDRVF